METAFDIISLVLFIVVILLAFFRKVNVGVVAVTFGVIMVRIFGLTDKDLIGGFSTSMFTTLVGITLLFAAITQTGALDLLARKIIALAGNKMWVLPIMVYIAGFVIAGEQGLMAGRMTPITPEAAIITGAAAEANIANVMPTILVCQTLVTIVSSLVFWFIFKGHKVKQPLNPIERGTLEKFNAKQIISLLSIVLMLVLLIFVKVNIGVAAFAVAGLLFLFGVADDGKALKSLPWGTIVMVLAVGSLLNIVNKMGGIDLMSNALAKIMTKGTATPFMGISAALLSLVSSALGVVYPTMMPMCADIAAQVGGVNPVALMAAVGAGGSLSGISPLSTGGALAMAALATALPNRTKEDENKTFVQLFIYAGLAILILIVLCSTIYVPLANLLHGA